MIYLLKSVKVPMGCIIGTLFSPKKIYRLKKSEYYIQQIMVSDQNLFK